MTESRPRELEIYAAELLAKIGYRHGFLSIEEVKEIHKWAEQERARIKRNKEREAGE